MTPEQQRIKIAESVGWLVNKDGRSGISPINREQGLTNPEICSWILPDYLNDLNAMAEAEKSLPDLNLYRKFLYLVVLDDPTNTANEPAFATASQRAEAFLRTLGLWTA